MRPYYGVKFPFLRSYQARRSEKEVPAIVFLFTTNLARRIVAACCLLYLLIYRQLKLHHSVALLAQTLDYINIAIEKLPVVATQRYTHHYFACYLLK